MELIVMTTVDLTDVLQWSAIISLWLEVRRLRRHRHYHDTTRPPEVP